MRRYLALLAAAGLILAVTGSAGATTYAEWKQAVIDAGDYLLGYQNDDGGWPWKMTAADRVAFDGSGASPGNTIGATARGLIRAYEVTGDSEYLTACNKAAALLLANNNYYNKDVEFAHELAALGGSDIRASANADAITYFSGKASAGVSAAQGLHDAYWSAYPTYNGLNEWMLGEWVHVGRLIGATEIYTAYTGDQFAVELAGLVAGDYGTPFDTTPGAYGLTLGLVGTLEAAYWNDGTAGSTTALADLKALLASAGDKDTYGIQDMGYTTYILGLLGDPMAMTGTVTLMDWQDASGGWIYSTGDLYTEGNGEALMGLAMNPIPEPLTMLGVFGGLAGLAGYVRRRKRA